MKHERPDQFVRRLPLGDGIRHAFPESYGSSDVRFPNESPRFHPPSQTIKMYLPTIVRRFSVVCCLVVCLLTTILLVEATAIETISVVYGIDAPEIERLAANELAVQFHRIFQQ